MRNISVELEGIVPILFNRFFDPDALDRASTKKTKQQKLDEVRLKVYRDTDDIKDYEAEVGPIGVPANNVKKTILQGCRSATIKLGRKSAEPYMRACVFLDSPFVAFDGKTTADGTHECTGNIPPGPRGVKAILRRPYLKAGWKLRFNLMIVDDRISPEAVHTALAEGGLMIGLCDHRPEYGRFKVNSFESQEGR